MNSMSQHSQQPQQQQQPLKLRNPTPYHILASAGFNHSAHPLSDESLDNYIFEEQQQDKRTSFSSSISNPMELHRRSSTATDTSFHQMFIPETTTTTDQLATSAPSSMGFEYHPFQQPGSIETNSNNHLAKSLEDEYTLQMNMQVMMEKRRKRRESHNAVERRRRDNINDRIQELCDLLPESTLESTSGGPNNKPNKGVILKKSVDHIRQLQQQLQSYHQRVQELEDTLKLYNHHHHHHH